MKRIVIIGGGFGGVYTAKHLLKQLNEEEAEIILLNKTNYFLFTPMLHEVATGGLNRHHVVETIRKVMDHKYVNFHFMKCTVEKIDFKKKIVQAPEVTIPYDILVMAIGAKANFYGVRGADQYALALKTIHDANRIRNTIIENLETASRLQWKKNIEPYLTFVVIGGGPTGVEVIAEMQELVEQMLRDSYAEIRLRPKFYLVQSSPIIVPFMHPMCRAKAMKRLEKMGITVLLNARAKEIKREAVLMDHEGKQRELKSQVIVWAGGVQPNVITTAPKVTNEQNRYVVDEFFQVNGVKDVYAIGDCALFVNPGEEKPVPALAQVAVEQGRHLAKNLVRKLQGKKQVPFSFKPKGLLISLGKGYGVAELGKIKFKGFFAWWLIRTIYLFKLIGRANKFKVAYEWTVLLFSDRDTSQV